MNFAMASSYIPKNSTGMAQMPKDRYQKGQQNNFQMNSPKQVNFGQINSEEVAKSQIDHISSPKGSRRHASTFMRKKPQRYRSHMNSP